jgi:hypothetical protein
MIGVGPSAIGTIVDEGKLDMLLLYQSATEKTVTHEFAKLLNKHILNTSKKQ